MDQKVEKVKYAFCRTYIGLPSDKVTEPCYEPLLRILIAKTSHRNRFLVILGDFGTRLRNQTTPHPRPYIGLQLYQITAF